MLFIGKDLIEFSNIANEILVENVKFKFLISIVLSEKFGFSFSVSLKNEKLSKYRSNSRSFF